QCRSQENINGKKETAWIKKYNNIRNSKENVKYN
ncbi:unnamed protein product, partial [marine sediment metagenome]